MFVGYFVLGKTRSKIIYNQIFCSHFNFPPFAFINISCNNMISMIWRVNTCHKQQRKQVTYYLQNKTKTLFRKKIIQSSQLTTFSFKTSIFLLKLSSALLFHFFKTVKFATFSLKTIMFATFIQNCLVCHFFNWHCRARYFFLFSIVMGSLLFHSKPSTLSLSFDPACYFFTGNDQARYFLFQIVKSATFFNLKVVKNIEFATFLSKTV